MTMHELSAAYVAAAQTPIPQVKPSATYEPACISTWTEQMLAMDEMILAARDEGQK